MVVTRPLFGGLRTLDGVTYIAPSEGIQYISLGNRLCWRASVFPLGHTLACGSWSWVDAVWRSITLEPGRYRRESLSSRGFSLL